MPDSCNKSSSTILFDFLSSTYIDPLSVPSKTIDYSGNFLNIGELEFGICFTQFIISLNSLYSFMGIRGASISSWLSTFLDSKPKSHIL